MSDHAYLILHPLRMRILLLLSNQQLSPLQLRERLGNVSQATLYRHINLLTEAGLLSVVEENQVRGTIERVYTATPGSVSLSEDDLRNATPEDHMRYFTVFISSLLSDFARYLEQGEPDLQRDMVGYGQVALNLSDEELIEVSQKISAAIHPHSANKLEGERRTRIMTTILMPDVGEPRSSKE